MAIHMLHQNRTFNTASGNSNTETAEIQEMWVLGLTTNAAPANTLVGYFVLSYKGCTTPPIVPGTTTQGTILGYIKALPTIIADGLGVTLSKVNNTTYSAATAIANTSIANPYIQITLTNLKSIPSTNGGMITPIGGYLLNNNSGTYTVVGTSAELNTAGVVAGANTFFDIEYIPGGQQSGFTVNGSQGSDGQLSATNTYAPKEFINSKTNVSVFSSNGEFEVVRRYHGSLEHLGLSRFMDETGYMVQFFTSNYQRALQMEAEECDCFRWTGDEYFCIQDSGLTDTIWVDTYMWCCKKYRITKGQLDVI